MTILFLAGEPSGDEHCAQIVRLLRGRHPDWTIYAFGGRALRDAGAHIVGDTSGLGVIGFASAVAVLPRALKLQAKARKFLQHTRVDLAVPCDWGAFNGRLLPDFQKRGVPVLYYFPPRSWAREGQSGLQIAPLVTQAATPFPWSAQRLRNAGANAEWVGHPLLEAVDAAPSREQLRAEWKLAPHERVVALLPGSRRMEVELLAPVLAGVARALQNRGIADRFLVAATLENADDVRRYFPAWCDVIAGRAIDVLKVCDAAIVKSGTSTLQAAACDAPQVIVYDVPPLLRAQWKLTGMAKRTPFVGMPNIILERESCRELLGPNCSTPNIVREVTTLLENGARAQQMRRDYVEVRRVLGRDLKKGASERVVEMIEEVMSRE